jgi:hypothetical protein
LNWEPVKKNKKPKAKQERARIARAAIYEFMEV